MPVDGIAVALLSGRQGETCLQRDVDAWMAGFPWGALHPAAIDGVVKSRVDGMAHKYGLTLTW